MKKLRGSGIQTHASKLSSLNLCGRPHNTTTWKLKYKKWIEIYVLNNYVWQIDRKVGSNLIKPGDFQENKLSILLNNC